MLLNYLKVTFRMMLRSKMFSVINVASLAVGLAACLVIFLFIRDERSFDSFHTKRNSIYRLDEIQNFTGTKLQNVALSMPGMGPSIAEEFPEVITYTRFWGRGKRLVQYGDRTLLIENVAVVDSTFLEVFDFPLLHGNRETILDDPYTIAFSETTALKFFSSVEDALDKTVMYRDRMYKITGILKDVPENSHLQFNILISMPSATRDNPQFNNQWGSNFLNTYFVLHENADVKAMESRFPAVLSRHMDDPKITEYYQLFLQRLDEIHLASIDIEHDYNNYRKFNGEYLDVFSVVGIFILVIASVNFMNLTTARASYRWKEVGVRKTVGSKQFQLFIQFTLESLVLAVFALGLAMLLVQGFLPILNTLIGRRLSMGILFEPWWQFAVMLAGALMVGLLAGIYPSLYITSGNLSRIFKGGGAPDGKSIFRSSLVVIQFGLSLAMIVSTIIVVQQLSFMKNKDLGFNKDHIMVIDMNREVDQKFEALKTELLKHHVIEGVTASGQRIGNNLHQNSMKLKYDTGMLELAPSNINVDFDYLKVYGIKIKQGRDFAKEIPMDNGFAFIVNEASVRDLGIKNPIGVQVGQSWLHNDSLGSIVGVVEDFNFNSLHHKINPLYIYVRPEWGYDEISVKIKGSNVQEAISVIQQVWNKHITGYPMDYTFLDEHFDLLYRSDEQMSAVVSIMAGLAILISCMGLFGLAAIATEKKTKEIGIRKVLGATEAQITLLLSRNFTLLIAIAFVLAAPPTYWLLHAWLENFAYRVSINPFVFLAGGVVALLIALLTIAYHTLRAARSNPVKSLRYE